MHCHQCGQTMQCQTGEYHYTECGLDFVYLDNEDMWQCPCGETMVGIPAVPKLHTLIGEKLIFSHEPLIGSEIRFLRKNMGQTPQALADILGVDQAELKAWEKGGSQPGPGYDRLIRLLYCSHKDLDQKALIEGFDSITRTVKTRQALKLPKEAWNPCASDTDSLGV